MLTSVCAASACIYAVTPSTHVAPSLSLYQTTDTQCDFARVLGASWGLEDVTREVGHRYNSGTKIFTADRTSFGEGGIENEVLTIVHDLCGNVAVATATDGAEI